MNNYFLKKRTRSAGKCPEQFNTDGKRSTAEASGLRLWADANENGRIDSGELQGVGTEIKGADYGFYTRGNGQLRRSAFNGAANAAHWRQVS